jgi:tetratricopeptide (TPR) repeat protein
MGFRFFKRLKIAPGLSINFSKSGMSLSMGPRGAKCTIGPRGIRSTVGIPGTGLYYTTQQSSLSGRAKKQKHVEEIKRPPQPPTPEELLNLGFFQKLVIPSKEVNFVEGCKMFLQGKRKEAYYYLKISCQIADSAFLAGILAIQEKRYEEGCSCLEMALAQAKDLGSYFRKYKVLLKIDLPVTNEIVAVVEPTMKGVLIALVEVCQELEEDRKAIEYLKRLSKLEPDDIVVKVSLAEFMFHIGHDNVKCLKYIVGMAKGISNDSDFASVLLLYKSKALRSLGMHEAVKDTLVEIQRRERYLNPELSLAVQYEKALMYMNTGQKILATSELQKIYAKDPGYEDVAQILDVAGAKAARVKRAPRADRKCDDNIETIDIIKFHPNPEDHRAAINWAKHVLSYCEGYVILDSETTGLGNRDEIIQLAVIDPKGTVLFNENIKPTSKKTITKDAAKIHGITMESLATCNTLYTFAEALKRAIGCKTIISYNAKFDRRMYNQSYKRAGGFLPPGEWNCAMLEYAKFFGEWDDYHGEYKWHSLEEGDHTALGDCRATLDLIRSMAQGEIQ